MSKRTKEEIAREYSNLCTKAGHAAYQVATIQKDIEMFHSTMRDLNLEAAAAASEEAKKEEAPNA